MKKVLLLSMLVTGVIVGASNENKEEINLQLEADIQEFDDTGMSREQIDAFISQVARVQIEVLIENHFERWQRLAKKKQRIERLLNEGQRTYSWRPIRSKHS